MSHSKLCIIPLIFASLIMGCGRKQRNIFSFEPEPEIKITKLDLPSVTGLHAVKTNNGNLLTWFDLFLSKKNIQLSLRKNFVGYDVFKLTKQNFIPKTPLNKKPLAETQFLDINIKDSSKADTSKIFYLIQPIFKFDNQIIKGPSSQIVGI